MCVVMVAGGVIIAGVFAVFAMLALVAALLTKADGKKVIFSCLCVIFTFWVFVALCAPNIFHPHSNPEGKRAPFLTETVAEPSSTTFQ